MNRGSTSQIDDHVIEVVASMRPRFMNRGSSLGRLERAHRHALASMRPRFMNRGSATGGERNPSRRYRFNEAPIHESGKSPGGGPRA